MNAAPSMFDVGATVLGYVGIVASWRRPVDTKRYLPMVVIYESGGTEGGVHTPATSVTIQSREGLIALRQAINEALGEGVAS